MNKNSFWAILIMALAFMITGSDAFAAKAPPKPVAVTTVIQDGEGPSFSLGRRVCKD